MYSYLFLTNLLVFSGAVEEIVLGPGTWGSGSGSDSRGSTRNNRGFSALRAIVTGLENSGTSVTSKILFNAPCVIGGSETGFLAAKTPSEIRELRPWMKWHMDMNMKLMYHLKPGDVDAMADAKDFPQLLDILRNRSYLFNDLNDEPYCDKPYQIIDKTPRYVKPAMFERILKMTHGAKVPVVVLKKNIESLNASWVDRGARILTSYQYYHTYNNVQRMISKYPNRIMVVNWEDIMHDVESVMQDIFQFIGLEWKTDYLKMTNLMKKFANYGDDMLKLIALWEWNQIKSNVTFNKMKEQISKDR